jgi:hypothetical protein
LIAVKFGLLIKSEDIMLDKMVESMINRIKDEVVTDANMTEVPLAYLMTREIPDSVKHFLDQEVELWIREEEEKFSTSDRFDYDVPEVRMLIDKIFDQLKQNARFHINKFNQLLERSLKLEMNYIIEPQRTLTQFIFKDSPVVSTIEVYDTLKYFFKYEYYIKAISDYFNTKYLREISQDQFKELIAQIDENVFKEKTFETTLKTVKAIIGFISEAIEKPIDVLDLDILTHAFKDRHLDTYAKLIDDLKKEGTTEIALADLEKILREESLAPLKAEKEIVEEIEESKKIIEEIEDIEESKPEVAVADIEISEMKVEEVEEEEEEEEEVEEEIEEEEEEEAVAAKEAAPKRAGVADELASFVAGQISSDQPLEDLNKLFVGRSRKRVLKKLFKKDEKAFTGVLNQLNALTAWKDASLIIDDEFYERGINPYSKEAILFSDTIYTRFFPKDKYVGEKDADNKFD